MNLVYKKLIHVHDANQVPVGQDVIRIQDLG